MATKDIKDDKERDKFKDEFLKDVEAQRSFHKKHNYHYLMYKGILWLNSAYGQDYIKSVGLQVNVPRTFTAIESIRSNMSGRTLDIDVTAYNRKENRNKEKARHILRSEWGRSKSDNAKSDAEYYSLMLGTGYVLTKYLDDKRKVPVYKGMDKDGKPLYEKEEKSLYQGMKLYSLNPWNVFRDRNATTDTPGDPGSWGHCFVYSLWDADRFNELAKNIYDYNGKIEKGGHIEEFDKVRKQIDVIYGSANLSLKTRDNGTLLTEQPVTAPELDKENMLMVVERYAPDSYEIRAGNDWVSVYKEENTEPDQIIPIGVMRDYRIPDEFEGIGEPEVLRWQQYEENKVHNLSYMAVLMNTIQRFAVVENYLQDPTEANFNNPLKWIKMKPFPGADINKIIQPLNTKSSSDIPLKFLQEIKNIGNEATGANAYITAASQSQVNTLGEANILQAAGMKRINDKLFEMEERDLIPILEHWLTCIPLYYTEELDLLLNDGDDYYVKWLPYDRESSNYDTGLIAKVSTEEGITIEGRISLEDLYKKAGYKDVVFSSDIVSRVDLKLKTTASPEERQKLVQQFGVAVKIIMLVNQELMRQGRANEGFDVAQLGEDMLGLFPDLIKDIEDYRMKIPVQTPIAGTMPASPVITGEQQNQPQPDVSEGLMGEIDKDINNLNQT